MAFESLQQFFEMGGHARFVWSAWGMTAVLLVACVVHARHERRRLLRDLRRLARRERQVESAMPRTDVDDT